MDKNTVSMKTSVVGCRKTGTGWLTAGPHLAPGRASLSDPRITTLLVLAGGSRYQTRQTHTGKTSRWPFGTDARPIWARLVRTILSACGLSNSKRLWLKQQSYHSPRLLARMFHCGLRGSFDRLRNLLSHRCVSKKPTLWAVPGRLAGFKQGARVLGEPGQCRPTSASVRTTAEKAILFGNMLRGTNSIG